MPKYFSKLSGVMTSCLLVLIACLIIGCGAGRTIVVSPAESLEQFSAAEIIEDKSTVSVPSEVNTAFQTKLSQLLFTEGGFTRGPGLKIS